MTVKVARINRARSRTLPQSLSTLMLLGPSRKKSKLLPDLDICRKPVVKKPKKIEYVEVIPQKEFYKP